LTRRAKVQAVKIQKELAEKLHRNTHEDGSLTVLEDSEDAKKLRFRKADGRNAAGCFPQREEFQLLH